MKNKFLSNLFAAFFSQGVSLLLSLLMSLFLPKILGVDQYGYCQLFIFYTSYVGLFHFGINDGLYLRLGGQEYEALDYKKLNREYQSYILFQILVAILLGIWGLMAADGQDRMIIFVGSAIFLVLNNLAFYLGYIFQAVNETQWFSYSILIDKLSTIIFLLGMFVFQVHSFVPFVIAYTASKIFALAYCLYKGRHIAFGKETMNGAAFKESLSDLYMDGKIGIHLTISNIASQLVLGIGRLVIDNEWGIEAFGKISFSLSVMNLFLVFIQQISMVMFPALRRMDPNHQKKLYENIHKALNLILPLVLVLYFPMEYLLNLWLPDYHDSLVWLAYLLPLCIFEGKTQMLFSTYFKVLRMEVKLMQINVASLILSALLCGTAGFIFHSMTGVVICMAAAIIFKSILSDWILSRTFHIHLLKDLVLEMVLIGLYLAAVLVLPGLWAFIITFVAYGIYVLLNAKTIGQLIQKI